MTFELAEALYHLKSLRPEELGSIGVALLSSGRDTPAVRELAFLAANTTWREAADVFDRVLLELGRSPLDPVDAAYRVAELSLADVIAGRLTPYEGAARIAYGPFQAAGMPEDLVPFYYWAMSGRTTLSVVRGAKLTSGVRPRSGWLRVGRLRPDVRCS